MHFVSTFVASVSVLASAVSAAKYTVNVGETGLTYTPSSLSGVVAGDQISFKFYPKNHTITQSTFASPCVAKADGVNSGFVPVAADTTAAPEWTIQVDNVTAPLWFYCAQGTHCKAGMVFAINPTADKTFETFLATAKGTTTNTTTASGTAATAGTTGTTTSNGGTTVVNTTASGAGAATTSATTSSALTPAVQKAATLLAALGVVAGLTL